MDTDRLPDFEATNGDRAAQVIQIETPVKALLPLCILSLAIALATAAYAFYVSTIAREAKTQAWLAERRLLDIEAYAMLNHWTLPSDQNNGPLGNLERMKESTDAR